MIFAGECMFNLTKCPVAKMSNIASAPNKFLFKLSFCNISYFGKLLFLFWKTECRNTAETAVNTLSSRSGNSRGSLLSGEDVPVWPYAC